MAYEANEAYLEAQVMSASPLELVRILYGALTEAVRKARAYLAAGDIRARSREISRAVAILAELSGSLDPARGGEMAARLAALYDYMSRQLLEAHLRQSDAPLAEVLDLLNTLGPAWSAASGPEQKPVRAPAARYEAAWA